MKIWKQIPAKPPIMECGGRASRTSGDTALHHRRASGFTMVEIALSLGILAFALVAIVGVLPSGLTVQRENREQTMANQDAMYLLEAIRSGSKGVDDLTNYIESISVTNYLVSGSTSRLVSRFSYTNTLFQARPPYVPLTNAQQMISILSTPKLELLPSGAIHSNVVTARMRSMTGDALQTRPIGLAYTKASRTDSLADFTLRYLVTVEVIPYSSGYVPNAALLPPPVVNRLFGDPLRAVNLAENLYDVRVTLRWPLLANGTGGRYRRTVRTMVSGELLPVYTNTTPYLYSFQPETYVSAH
jgi:type II secretory pathway pseudopilin PulG